MRLLRKRMRSTKYKKGNLVGRTKLTPFITIIVM